jgi:hypothetical protein
MKHLDGILGIKTQWLSNDFHERFNREDLTVVMAEINVLISNQTRWTWEPKVRAMMGFEHERTTYYRTRP